MTIRPSENWRTDPELSVLRSTAVLDSIDDALQAFETELAAFRHPSDDQVFDVVKHVVLALNDLDADHGAGFDTIDREELCEYIDDSLTEAGIDVEALAQRRGIDPSAITDEWRDW
jgi:hypothetical protein